MFVVTKIFEAEINVSSPVIDTVEQPLKPNQQNQRMKQPRAPSVNECPGIALGFPLASYFPILGPKNIAPINAATPPTI